MKTVLLILLLLTPTAFAADGSVCLGPNFGKMASNDGNLNHLQVDPPDRVPYPSGGDPRIIAPGLPLGKHRIRVYFRSKVMASWRVTLTAQHPMVMVWRAAGSWRTDVVDTCEWKGERTPR